ncbi:MAG: hypothetical protein ACLUOQ_02100 [Barnesiella intestinihominis]
MSRQRQESKYAFGIQVIAAYIQAVYYISEIVGRIVKPCRFRELTEIGVFDLYSRCLKFLL